MFVRRTAFHDTSLSLLNEIFGQRHDRRRVRISTRVNCRRNIELNPQESLAKLRINMKLFLFSRRSNVLVLATPMLAVSSLDLATRHRKRSLK